MSEPDNVLLVYLRRIDEKVDCVIDDLRHVKVCVTNLEEGHAAVNRRLDCVEAGLDRIERRIDLVRQPH